MSSKSIARVDSDARLGYILPWNYETTAADESDPFEILLTIDCSILHLEGIRDD